ncbi:hypothetical protein ABZ568_00670 [Streptomyces olindensis]|uniref:Uncharacterized protein n=1 Tax=Streptomyces olindensis TaxID=358823 RepID=A0ABV2XLU4_9ACTN
MPNLTATRVVIPGVIGPYDAHVNLDLHWNGSARPLFTLDTARQIAADTQAQADECGSDSVITAHIIDGDPGRDGEARSVVLVVNWQWWDQDKSAKNVTTIIEPTVDGLYGIGASSWNWEYQIWDCHCEAENPWHIEVCRCGQPRDLQTAVPDGMIATRVCIDGPDTYPALIVEDDRHGGRVTPYFTLDGVRQLAADTHKYAERDPRSAETIHILETAPDAAGERGTIVLHADWVVEDQDGPADAARVVAPNEHGLYRIGPDWHWSLAWWWCACETYNHWHEYRCSGCGMTRAEQPKKGLEAATWKAARLLRALAPEATSALVDLTDLPRICTVYAGDTELDMADDTGPFDTETLGAADEALRQALDDVEPSDLAEAGWEPVADDESDHVYRVTFPAARQ